MLRCVVYRMWWRNPTRLKRHNLASTTALYVSFSASIHMPWLRRTFIAYRDCSHLQITSRTCSLMDKWLVTVIPRILICVARWMSVSVGEYWTRDLRLRSSKIISTNFVRFSFKLFLCTHSGTRSSSSSLDWTAFLTGITTYRYRLHTCVTNFLVSQWIYLRHLAGGKFPPKM